MQLLRVVQYLRCALFGLIGCAMSAWVQAGTAEIRAQFRPDPANPMFNQFKNITPSSGYCDHFIAFCTPRNLFSLQMPLGGLPQTTGGPVPANHSDPRQGAYWKVPSHWQTIDVVNLAGDREQVEIRISGIGGRADHGGDVNVITGGGGYEALWSTGRWHNAPSPCVPGGGLNGTSYYVVWFWLVPENASACSTRALFDLPNFNYRYIHFGYELRTPNPLTMPTGIYRGSVTYTVGPGMDFDFGDRIVTHDNIVTLEFTLDVEHTLKVELPPGGDRIELLPEGGWQAWLNQGRRPARLFRDQTFTLAASSRFKMNLECGLVIGNTCGLRNGEGDEVPVQIAVTLPYGLRDQYDQPVNKLPLRLDGVGSELFQPLHYVDNRSGKLHFEVGQDDVGEMLKTPGTTYSGTATVVWDSEV